MKRKPPEYDQVISYLQTPRRIQREIDHFQEELKRLEYMRDAIVKPITERTSSGSPGNPTEKKAEKILDRKAKILDKLVQLTNQIEDVEVYILASNLSSIQQTVLLKRYIEFKTWEQISEEMHYSKKHPTKIRNQAIYNLCNQIRKQVNKVDTK